MKEQLINLIIESNSKENGIKITIPVEQYVEKIFSHSTIIPYYVNGKLKGLISYYNNDETKERSYLTLLLISKDYQGKGIGRFLLEMSISDLKNNGFNYYSLEVLKNNDRAIRLYTEYSFQKKQDKGELWLMEKTLI